MGPSICPLKAIIAKVGGSLHGVFLFKGMFQRREVRVEDAPAFAGKFPHIGFKPSTFRCEGKRANQYTTIASDKLKSTLDIIKCHCVKLV